MVVASKTTQVSRCSDRGHGAFPDAGYRWSIVGEVFDRGIANGVGSRHDIYLRQKTSVLEVAVGDGTVGVASGHHLVLDRGREWVAPDVGLSRRVKVDAAHARFGSIGRSQESGFLGDDFSQVSGSLAQASGQPAEGVKAVTDEAVHSDTVPVRFVLRPLECAEQTCRAWDGH